MQMNRIMEALEQDTHDDHRHLLGLVRGLETMLEAAEPAPGDLQRRLAEVTEAFANHFADEEGSDFYNLYLERYPEHRHELKRLAAEHEPMIGDLRAVTKDAGYAKTISLSSPLSIRIRDIVARFRRHEVDEASILARIHA